MGCVAWDGRIRVARRDRSAGGFVRMGGAWKGWCGSDESGVLGFVRVGAACEGWCGSDECGVVGCDRVLVDSSGWAPP